MNKGKENKKRAPNFSSKEETVLVALVKKYKTTLECKLTDVRTHSDKAACWTKIEREYNASCGEVFRPKDVLRKKYENIKKRVKKKYADEKCYSRGTGGGPPQNSKFTELDSEVKEMLGKRIEGHNTEFGGDAGINETQEEESSYLDDSGEGTAVLDQEHEYEEITLEVPQCDGQGSFAMPAKILTAIADVDNMNEAITEASDWANYTPQMLRNAKNPVLNTNKKKGAPTRNTANVQDKVSQWAEAKSNIEASKQKYLEKEQEMKLQFLREKHEVEISIMRQKAQLVLQNEQTEHNLRVEILELQKQKMGDSFD